MRFLAAWELGHRLGHVAKLAPIAEALGQRGHGVWLAAREVAAGHAAPGAPFERVLQAPMAWGERAPPTPRTYAELIADAGFGAAVAALPAVRAWLTLFDLAQPNAILAEHAPAAVLAAYVAGLPAHRIGTGLTAPRPARPFPAITPWAPASEVARAEADAPANRAIGAITAAFGRPDPGGLAGLLALSDEYLATWPELDHMGARADAFYYGPLGGWRAEAEAEWPEGSGPRAFVYLPFEHPDAVALAQALGTLGWPALWHSRGTPAFALPANLRIAAEPLRLDRALGEAALLVSRASHGTCAEALRAGCPSLLLPDNLETTLVAWRMLRGEFARAPPQPNPAPATIAALAREIVADEAIGLACHAARDRYRSYDAHAATRELADDILTPA